MNTEQLQLGQGAIALGAAPQSAELNAGGQATHGENTGLPFLGSGSEAGKAALAKFEAAGMVERSKMEMGGGGGAREAEIRSQLRKYEGNWNSKQDAEKDRFSPAWEMVLKAQLGSESAKKWCQDNSLSLDVHGEVFRQLAAKRRAEKMTVAERVQGLTAEFLVFRDILPHLLGNQELINQRSSVLVQQQGGQNAV